MSKKDEQLINRGDDVEEEDKYSVALVDNPIYDVDPDEKTGTVAYYKSGQDEDDDEEELVKVCTCPITDECNTMQALSIFASACIFVCRMCKPATKLRSSYHHALY